ncbi:adenosylcobinamide-GDP ribazoletransferase [Saccharospirillum impatiens]|uniref:adenosylcobinamide-GDP ribazoletransferase n=1 Tax=Saccharospirillum impatiens TaxID=169438 RepID=UPI0004297DD3|nr:adenosylcobinamide-GDP ribazoletransferase [Saccharospirillum impatiens]
MSSPPSSKSCSRTDTWPATQWHSFFNAWVFFSRLPQPPGIRFNDHLLNHSSRYFTWVGAILGLLLAGVLVLGDLLWNAPLAVALMLAASLLLTGAFHEDGLADLFDGFGGGFSREAVLSIMKDSRLGTYGAAALVVTLLVRWLAWTTLFEQGLSVWWALPFIAAWSRFWAISTLWTLPYARDHDQDQDSKSKPLATRFGLAATGVALVPLLGLIGWLTPGSVLGLTLAALTLRIVLNRWFMRRIQGYTGDCLGGAQQLQETLALLVLLGLIT